MKKRYFTKLIGQWNGVVYTDHKLYLCSRDIQIGDRIYYEPANIYGEYRGGTSMILKDPPKHTHFPAIDLSRVYKVIGEIPPEHSVREGLELNRDDFKIIGTDNSKITCQIDEEDLKNGYHVVRVEITLGFLNSLLIN